MKIIEPAVIELQEDNPYKLVESVGRTCYKSENSITDTSYIKFVSNCISRQHFAMLEHGHVYFQLFDLGDKHYTTLLAVAGTDYVDFETIPLIDEADVCRKLGTHWIFAVSLSHLYHPQYAHISLFEAVRNLAEFTYLPGDTHLALNSPIDADKLNVIRHPECVGVPCDIQLLCPESVKLIAPQLLHHSMRFTCDRGVSHELVRHRCAVAQESTRYCNYHKSRFGNAITVIKPVNIQYDTPAFHAWEQTCLCAERCYMAILEDGLTPQDARSVLPNSLKTEVVLTMSIRRWQHFINLRSLGTTGAPHPDMKVVADKVANILQIGK